MKASKKFIVVWFEDWSHSIEDYSGISESTADFIGVEFGENPDEYFTKGDGQYTVSVGAYIEDACVFAGISSRQFRRWRELAEQGVQPFAERWEEINKSESQSIVRNLFVSGPSQTYFGQYVSRTENFYRSAYGCRADGHILRCSVFRSLQSVFPGRRVPY